MPLEELQKKLYEQKGEAEKREGAPGQFEPGQRQDGQETDSSQWQKEALASREPFLTEKRKKLLRIIIIGLVGIVVVVGGFLFWRSRSFDTSKVLVTVFGVDRVASGEEVSYAVRYQNNTNVTLTDVKLTFIYPPDSLPIDKQNLTKIGDQDASVVSLADLQAGKEGKMEFRANISGLKDDQKKAVVKLSYHAGDTSSSFESSGEFLSVIFSVPLVLNFSLPERVVNGQQLDIVLKYLNTSDIGFLDLALNMEYPPGFNFISSQPSPSQGSNSWRLPEISPQEEGQIVISGVLTGAQEEVKAFRANIAKLQGDSSKIVSEGLGSTLISLSPLSVALTVNDSRDYLANVGEHLTYKLTYQNTVDIPIGPVIIIVKLDTKALDLSSVKADKGFFNSVDSSIIWNESVLPDLKMVQPGAKNEINFYVNVKDSMPVASFNDKNFVISVSSKIDSTTIPVSLRGTQISGTDSLSTKVNAKLTLSSKGYFKDLSVPNSGPIPPRVGQETTYTIYWDTVNAANDVDHVVVEGYSPPYVRWVGLFDPASANVKYDKNSGKITWTIGKLPANTGILYPVKRLVFKIGFTPSSSQVGQMIDLVSESTISGSDTFTGASLQGTARAIRSDLPDDSSIGYDGGKVIQ